MTQRIEAESWVSKYTVRKNISKIYEIKFQMHRVTMIKNSCERRVIWWKVMRIWWGVVFTRELPPLQAFDISSCLLQGHSCLPMFQYKIILWGLSLWSWDNTFPLPSQFFFFFLTWQVFRVDCRIFSKSLCLNNSLNLAVENDFDVSRENFYFDLTNDSVLHNPIVPCLLLHDYNSECC